MSESIKTVIRLTMLGCGLWLAVRQETIARKVNRLDPWKFYHAAADDLLGPERRV